MTDMDLGGGVSAAPTSHTNARGGLTPEASRLFRVYKTVSAMLDKRGYIVPKDMKEITPASFTAKYGEFPTRESLTMLVVSVLKCGMSNGNVCSATLRHYLHLISGRLFIFCRKKQTTKPTSCLCSSLRTKRWELSQ
jgi:hypothetical protein